ncbi:protein TolQ [Candidatus Nitrotoga arctica]|uniref:Tol-Pal system protein TolQ n=1 Tax=Candidatus Nitrotoga arctica TaxID=453162 RepID=A0ABM8YXA3_9PROT|nr:protein TolQ [Candidatus Nitrotoga arctica]CAG9932155.1 Tol-Pal system protein TolQ [Candidatus Nitrotoga arctica]
MDVTQNLSFIHLIQNASVLVQLVMGLLLLVSLMSWWFIFLKMFTVRQAVKQSEEFEESFWNNDDLNRLYQNTSVMRGDSGSMGRIFASGFTEFLKLKKKHDMDNNAVMDGTRRAMRATYQREMDILESHLAFLATVGSVSPYVGLFGTVWGIMNAFRGLANVGQATLAHVAPGIAEALIATAMGLFAAIPAVVAYNRYSHDITRLSSRFEIFMEEFSNVLQRQP